MPTFQEVTGYVILEVEGPPTLFQTMTVWRTGHGRSIPAGPPVKWECNQCYSIANRSGVYRFIHGECEQHSVLIEAAIRQEVFQSASSGSAAKKKVSRRKNPPPSPVPSESNSSPRPLPPPRKRRRGKGGVVSWDDKS